MSSPTENANKPQQESTGQPKQENTSQRPESPTKAQTGPKDPFLVTLLFHIEGILKLLFVPILLALPWYSNHIVGIICLLGIIRQCKIPKFSKEYGIKLITNEFAQNLFYIVPFMFFPGSKHLIYYFPLAIHFYLGACQYVFMKQPALYSLFKGIIDFIRRNDRIIKVQRAKLEVLEIAFILILTIAGKSSLVLVLLYGNFIRIKYMLNEFTKIACAEMNQWLDKITNNPACPGIVKLLVQKFRGLCGYLTKMG